MRISPIFTKAANSSFSALGQSFKNENCRKPCPARNRMAQTDLFVRMAEASLKDAKIESELKSMGLI